MCTVLGNRTLSRQYIRNVYCAQREKSFQTVNQKCVLCTETEHFPVGIAEMRTMHRKKILRRYKKCAQKQNTFQAVYQKCVLCTEREQFPDGKSEMCIVHRNRTFSGRYSRNVYCAQKQNTFQTIHQKCVLCTETEHLPVGI